MGFVVSGRARVGADLLGHLWRYGVSGEPADQGNRHPDRVGREPCRRGQNCAREYDEAGRGGDWSWPPAGLGLGPYFRSQIQAIKMFDGVAFLGALAVVASAALVASSIPSWRAARVDPASTLRCE